MDNFSNSLSAVSLNPSQHQAVTHGEGPLLIIAGAGTGKTKVLTSRIIYLLQEKNIPADQIVALTFTEKATREMQERLDQALPLLYEEVTIKTFHGFCDQILRERGLEIGIDPGYTLLTQPQQWFFIKKHLFAFDLEYYRPLGNPSKFLHILLNHFSRLKDEDISPEKYLILAEEKVKQSENNETNEGEAEDHAAQKETALKQLEIAKAYQTYQQLLQQEQCLDFNDLIYYCLRLFEQRPSVLQEYQEQFRYILVDEFQDTNDAQYRLLIMLSKKYQNITVVGDDDQSIYKWRGASLLNMMEFEQTFPSVKIVALTQNYRSPQSVLDLSYGVIQHNNPHRLEIQQKLSKKLIAEIQCTASAPEIWHFDHYLQEIKAVVTKIQELLTEGVSSSSIAILFRTHQYAQSFIEALKNQNIPVTMKDKGGILKAEEIKDLIAVLRFVHNPHDNVALFRLLSMPLFNLPVPEVLALVQQAKDTGHTPLFYYLRKFFTDEAEASQPMLPGLNLTKEHCHSVYLLLEELLEQSRNSSVQRVIGQFLESTGYMKALTGQSTSENDEKIQRIAQFSDYINDFEQTDSQNSLAAFLDYLESLEEAGGGGVGVFSDVDYDAVNILTIHAAKGLEFDYVFIPSLVQHRFPAIKRRDPLEIPEELLIQPLRHSDEHIHEERRLFYVACTRAKKNLYLSYSNTYEGRKQWKISQFLQEAIGANTAMVKENTGFLVEPLVPLTSNVIQNKDQEKSSPSIKPGYKLSYSKIQTFDTCPLQYKFRYVFEIGTPSPHAANFGSSVHNTVHEFYKALKNGQEPTLALLSEMYEKCWIPKGYESRGHEQKRKEKGKIMMENFFNREQLAHFKQPLAMEKPFQLRLGAFSFKGRIDRIDRLEDGSLEIIDYKTGTSKRESDLRKDLQLSIYLMACENLGLRPISTLSLYFLEDAKKLSIKSTEVLVEQNRQKILELAASLQNSQFEATPGQQCSYCDYRILCSKAM